MTYQPQHPPTPTPAPETRRRFPFHKTRLFRAPGPGQQRTLMPSGWWLAVLFLGSVSLLMMSWGAYSLTPRDSEKDLRAERPSPMLSIIGGDKTSLAHSLPDVEPVVVAFLDQTLEPLPLPPPVVQAPLPLPEPMKIEVPQLPLGLPKIELPGPIIEPPQVALPKAPEVIPPLIGLPRPPEVIPPPLVAVHATVPIITEQLPPFVALNHHTGETPMIRNWKMVAFYSLFASAFAQAPAVAGDNLDTKKIIERLDKLQKTSDDIKTDVTGLKAAVGALQGESIELSAKVGSNKMKIDELESKLKDLTLKLDALSARPSGGGLDKVGFEEIRVKLGSIEQAILKLQPTKERVALAPPSAVGGRVVLVNLYGERLMFILNSKPYAVEPNTTLPVDGIPAGALTYEVRSPTFGLRARDTTNLNPNETFTLTAR